MSALLPPVFPGEGDPMLNVRADQLSENEISQVRAALGLTQQALARYLGLSRQQVARVECGLVIGFAAGTGTSLRMTRLILLLPPPAGVGPPDPPVTVPAAFEPAPLPAGLVVPAGALTPARRPRRRARGLPAAERAGQAPRPPADRRPAGARGRRPALGPRPGRGVPADPR